MTQPKGVTSNNVVSGLLGAVVRAYKSAVTKRINEIRATPNTPVWQRNYYEQVIRSEAMLNVQRAYIDANPVNWVFDQEFTQ